MKKFSERFLTSTQAAAFVRGVKLVLEIAPNPDVAVTRPDKWTVEVSVTEAKKPESRKAECRHLRGYWIAKGARFRCYICGHQFQMSEVEDDDERRIEVWKK